MATPDEPVLKALRDADRGRRNLAALAAHVGPAPELVAALGRLLPRAADPDMALNNLERLFAQPAARPFLPGLLESRARGLDAALTLLAASQFFADTLALYPDFLESVRTPPRRNPTTAELVAQLRADVDAAADDPGVLRALRRFRARHALRIGVNDILRDRPLEEVTRELARLADASVEVALAHATRLVTHRFGSPAAAGGGPSRAAVLGFGKLGGDELNYSSDVDLMVVYDAEGETTGRRTTIPTAEFYARVVQEVVRLLSAVTDRGFAYRVDLRLRPEGARGPLARSLAGTLSYYDTRGRTWERQALIKLRPVAGDIDLGREFLAAVEPFVYRKYFSFAEINEVKALKRQMERQAGRPKGGSGGEGEAASRWTTPADVKTGRGGIRDIEYTVQFLQLLNGGDLPAVRQRNTLLALEALEIAGCLTPHETYTLADAYRFLRKTEHRLQLLFDLQTHKLPTSDDELRTLARRMGYTEREEAGGKRQETEDDGGADQSPVSRLRSPQRRSPLDELPAPPGVRHLLVDPLDQFLKDLHDKTEVDRAVLNHLLHQSFPDAGEGDEPETDLILDPDPDDATVRAVLGRYPFRDVPKAYHNLLGLARESVPFLSDRRCRHFLASIAPRLLQAVADTPDPDEALTQLERVSASLGAKAVLWELFSANPATLRLYVDLCAGSPFLSGILINNPGMADELLDSLVLNQPRTADELRAELAELCRGASDPDPILHSFQDKELLRIGVADLLGMAAIRDTTAALSDLADTLLNQMCELVEADLAAKGGCAACYSLLGLGKLGGREISYHSDLDLLLVYEADSREAAAAAGPYFTELAQRLIKAASTHGPMGRLYAVDMRLRPTGKSGTLVLPLCELDRYYAGGGAQLWERQALTRARVVRGDAAFGDRVMARVRAAAAGAPWTPAAADEVRRMREKLEAGTTARNLKRGPGGLNDVEFLVQLLQLKHGAARPAVLVPNVWAALDALEAARLLPAAEASALRAGYSFLRLVEARLRVVTNRPLTELPDTADDLAKLARRLGFESAAAFLAEHRRVTGEIRKVYTAATGRERG
ncbi:bifunctional [glutamate--ammonia ligase]-adenylyl-L-tyrosine phosphorylase/[glutamate--ammonia-ligase] adenylyltransferase [Urbifossiella limnaea]|uniref:Glutamate-ammonia-ligase adenylyltransferase n=1 Tax=Urbifossiella limnaea TaxID=2528023 RepID=A0A517Y0A0_9BACT|nr:bifunctional [glutamate--ammonia ligase]-adenylyl-L-tyrosine phosphorylase/[glutamate--ammonia-ligase] adenylyltransferase [Urbifossiella limnaea]QDU23128.1 Glutamate-ammonia-ligase adenylyltransferase [Urbifossiella limnaea]